MYYNQNFGMPTFRDRFSNFIHSKSPLNRLIILNVIVWLFFLFLQLLFQMGGFFMQSVASNIFFQLILNKLTCPA
jgi:hypothetical protein